MDGSRQQERRALTVIRAKYDKISTDINTNTERQPLLPKKNKNKKNKKEDVAQNSPKELKPVTVIVERPLQKLLGNSLLGKNNSLLGNWLAGNWPPTTFNDILYNSMPNVCEDGFRWLLPRAPQDRLVYKNGDCNVTRSNINKRGQHYLADIFTTLIDIKWRWNLLIFVLAFSFSWIIFGLVWWLIAFAHGDIENYGQTGWNACVEMVHDFPTALLFSIETQQTIGYGVRYMTPYCVEAIVMVMFQSCFGIILQALMTGLVFAKLSRPKKRAQTLMFSKSALVSERDGILCLLFRVGDMRKSHIVEAQIRAVFVSKRVTKEGEVMPLFQHDLLLGSGSGEGRLFLVWPVIVEHQIDESSPLWDISADSLSRTQFEIIIILEGIVESTGMTTQARTSYLPHEVLWGHRFEKLIDYQRENGMYLVDYSRFNNVVSVEMSPASAKERAEGQAGSDSDTTVSSRNESLERLSKSRKTVPGNGDEQKNLSVVPASKANGINSMALKAFDLHNELVPPDTSQCIVLINNGSH